MNILISTTTNWNPGDEFIRYGCLYLFEKVFGSDHNYLFWNRNPDILEKRALSNSATLDEFNNMDLLLVAGTPDWSGDHYKPLYQYFVTNNKPIIFLGIGAADLSRYLTEVDKQALNRPNSLIICRDELTQKQVGGIVLPCPAFFCSKYKYKQRKHETGYIIQHTQVQNQNINNQIYKEIANLPDNNLICFYKDEYLKTIQNKKAYYNPDPKELLKRISEYDYIVSTRLHGAIGALSSGTRSVLLSSKDNHRIRLAQKPFGRFLPIVDTLDAAHNVVPISIEEILKFKNETETLYVKVLEEFKLYISKKE